MAKSLKSIIVFIILLSALFLLCLLAAQGEHQAAAQESPANAPYLNPDLPIEKRVADLIPRLTRKEKISLIYWLAPAIPRLGIQKYEHGNSAIHGVQIPGIATEFPQTIGLAASFDPDGVYQMAVASSDEFRAKHNLYKGDMPGGMDGCLTAWSPTINMARDPRWGRTQETYGEDPYLTSRMGVAYVKGMQGDDPKYLKVVACIKHFAGNNQEDNRFSCNAQGEERYWFEYEFPAYKACVQEAHAESVMTAFNAIYGVPCTGNKWLITDVLRGMWGFQGYVTSDCGAVSNMVDLHHYVGTPGEAIAAGLNAGLDMECGWFSTYPDVTNNYLEAAIAQGLTSEAALERALTRVLTARFKLGMFDPPDRVPYSKISPDVVACPKHLDLSEQLARESMVLLKNSPVNGQPLLPFDSAKVKTIAVLGPQAALCQLGDYAPRVPAGEQVTPLMGIQKRCGGKISVQYVPWSHGEMASVPTEALRLKPGSQSEAGLNGEYFLDERPEGIPMERRIDRQIKFDWAPTAYDRWGYAGNFSALWTGWLAPPISGRYVLGFTAEKDAKFRVLLDNRCIISRWGNDQDYAGDRLTAYVALEAGRELPLRVEYSHRMGVGKAELEWATPADAEAVRTAKAADVVVAVLGLNWDFAMEGHDLPTIEVPKDQEAFIESIVAANPRTVVVLINGNPLAIRWIKEHVPAILEAWYPGPPGGNAIAAVLFGDYNPAGRLPVTFYPSDTQLRPFDEYDLTRGRTYMYFSGEPLYAFGSGLSYTTFAYHNLKVSAKKLAANVTVEVSVDVTNSGTRDGDEVVQVYVHQQKYRVKQPIKQLRAFQRVHLAKGQKQTVTLSLAVKDWAYWDVKTHAFVVEPGAFDILVGASSADIRAQAQVYVR
ncbi:MAG: glycoside hydrolase family 3 C-terminal domain-containing protein [Acidobacteriia bacterium]|nr:glycoside hydrolase family 3 C-terminal domain-containing protein [Terriglobia bacterium]